MILDSDHMKLWACTSMGSCITGFVSGSLPYLQFTALCISIIAGVIALWGRARPRRAPRE
jgi:hypothetical protein